MKLNAAITTGTMESARGSSDVASSAIAEDNVFALNYSVYKVKSWGMI